MPRTAIRPASLASESFDVLVVGGGIVGAAVARDAAMRGLRVLLVEQHDFAFGTSSRSSRLLHGGLRYLAQGRIGLVREASREKRIVHRIAPHLAEPLAFLFPAYRRTGWSLWKLRVGVAMYDRLCGQRNLGPSSSLSADATRRLLPGLRSENLQGAVRYFDGMTNDARLVVDTLRSAAGHGAETFNYVRFDDARREGHHWHCLLEDRLEQQTLEVRAEAVVNATGPWSAQLPHSGTRLRLTKGVHLVLDRSRLPVPDAVVMTAGKRILFAIPWGDRVIVGTTDTDFAGSPESVRCEADDVQSVLQVVNASFPASALTPDDVRSAWAGLRPLVYDGRSGPSDISRRHAIRMSGPNWFDVTGGKLTTYRLIGEQTVDLIARKLGRSVAPCRTADEPLLSSTDATAVGGVAPPEVDDAIVRHCCRNEWAVHLDDVMIRRTSWRYYCDDHSTIARRVVRWMAVELGQDQGWQQNELDRYDRLTHSTG